MGKVCLVGCDALGFDRGARSVRIGAACLAEGEPITLDANEGRVFAGALRAEVERPEAWLAELRKWRAQPASAAA